MAIEFDGNSYFDMSGWPVPDSSTGIISVSWWMIPTNVAAGKQRPWGSETHMEARFGPKPTDIILSNDIFESDGDFDSTTVIADDTLYHVVCTGNANTDVAKVYIDGYLEGTYYTATGTTVGTVLSIGGSSWMPSSERYQGLIEDWRSYDRVLSDEEVATIFAARGVDGIVDGLTARFTFDEREPGHTAVAGDIKDIGPDKLTVSSVTGSPVYRENKLHLRRKRVLRLS